MFHGIYPNTEKRVENTTCSGVFFLRNLKCLDETHSRLFDLSKE